MAIFKILSRRIFVPFARGLFAAHQRGLALSSLALSTLALSTLAPSSRAPAQQLRHDTKPRISAGYQLTCATDDTSRPWCWGRGDHGQVGNGSTYDTMWQPERVLIHFPTAKTIYAGARIACGLSPADDLWCWGGFYGAYRGNPRAGKGTIFTTATHIAKSLELRSVATGATHTCAVTQSSEVWCWGGGRAGQTGNPAYAWVNKEPRKIEGLPPIQQVVTGLIHSCALAAAPEAQQQVWCWGSNRQGQLGEPDESVSRRAAAQPVAGLPATAASRVVALAAGAGHSTCALMSDHKAWCWGNNSAGQLGNGATASRQAVPVLVSQLTAIKAIAPGFTHTCALDQQDQPWCWGSGAQGELGHGSFESSLTAVKVQGVSAATEISAGYHSTCALVSSGMSSGASAGSAGSPELRCWGSNASGQLGVGQTPAKSALPLVVNLSEQKVR